MLPVRILQNRACIRMKTGFAEIAGWSKHSPALNGRI